MKWRYVALPGALFVGAALLVFDATPIEAAQAGNRNSRSGRAATASRSTGPAIRPAPAPRQPELVQLIVRGQMDRARALVERGANPNAAGSDGATALLVTARRGDSMQFLRLLLARGARVNVADRFGTTPLMNAADAGRLEVVRLLLESGAVVDAVDRFGQTALYEAAYSGHLPVVEELVARGADVNRANAYGMTPLMAAATRGHPMVAEALLRSGADENLRSRGGVTALGLATTNKKQETAAVLQNATALRKAALPMPVVPANVNEEAEGDVPASPESEAAGDDLTGGTQ